MDHLIREHRSYLLFLLLRLAFIFFGLGYIHPDGFFQGPEVVAGSIFSGIQTVTPWEFDANASWKTYEVLGFSANTIPMPPPCRTILTPFIVSGIPFALLKLVSGLTHCEGLINGYTLLYLPRIALFVLSVLVDIVVYCSFPSKTKNYALDAMSIMWPSLVFFTRPFSNTVDTFLLAFVFYVALNNSNKRIIPFFSSEVLLGFLCGVSVFNRFTFVGFAWPLVLYAIFKRPSTKPSAGSVTGTIGLWVWRFTNIVSGGLIACSLCIVLDSLYFGTKFFVDSSVPNSAPIVLTPLEGLYGMLLSGNKNIQLQGYWIVTPLNNLLYNLDPANLALHGLHPRYLHLLVNFPMLFGPFALALVFHKFLYRFLWSTVLGSITGAFSSRSTASRNKKPTTTRVQLLSSFESRKRVVYCLSALSILSGIAVLSMAPHQEPRFLLPLTVPVALLFGGSKPNKYFRMFCIVYGLALALFFGVLHQGGVIPSLLYLQGAKQPMFYYQQHQIPYQETHIIYYHTYMPPRHLLCLKKGSPFYVHDMAGASLEQLSRDVESIKERFASNQHGDLVIYLVAPKTVPVSLDSSTGSVSNATSSALIDIYPHVSTEDLPTTPKDACLSVYKTALKM